MLGVILAGGYGKRLRPLTNKLPKNLIQINDKPIIHHQIEWLKNQGVKRFLILTGYLSDKIVDYLGDGSRLGVEITYSKEEEPLGTGGAIKNAEGILSKEDEFILVNGDIITNLNIYSLIEAMEKHDECIGVLSSVPLPSPYGVIEFDKDGRIVKFVEKPLIEDYWINAGVYLFKRELLGYLPLKGDLEKTALPKLADERKLLVVKYMGVFWRSIDSHKDLEMVSNALKAYDQLMMK
jgi:NDP-sugar pyrophosphorylase family protein